METPPNGYFFEVLHYLSQEDDSVEAYIDEDGEVVFEIDYDEFVKLLNVVKEEAKGEENGEFS